MADKSAIEWTDAAWNPIRARFHQIQDDGSGKERIGWHCQHVSEACQVTTMSAGQFHCAGSP